MRTTSFITATAIVGLLAGGSALLAAPAGAAMAGHVASARADWKSGAKVAAADQDKYWDAARKQLAAHGARYTHEEADLTTLASIPETGTTAAQRRTAKRVTRELNGFFHTPGLYGVPAGNARRIAKADWIKSSKVAAAIQNEWFGSAKDELDSFGARYAAEIKDLTSLESIPLTSTTAKQRATARHDVKALDRFFHTPGVNR